MLTINTEHPYSADHFERKFQANISPSDQIFEKQEEESIKFKEEHNDKMRKCSSVLIQNEVLTLASKNPSYVDHFDRKFQANITSSDKSLEKQNRN